MSRRLEEKIRLIHLSLLRRGLSLQIPRMGIDRRSHLLALGLPGRLQNRVTQAERDGQVRLHPPCVLHVPLEFVGREMPVERRAIRQQSAGSRANQLIVIHGGEFGYRAHQVGKRALVGVGKSAIDRELAQAVWLRSRAPHPRWIGARGVERVCVRRMILMNQPPVAAHLDAVLALAPAQVVDNVVDRHAEDGRARLGRGVGQIPEIDIIARPHAQPAVALPHIAIANVVHHVRGDRPRIAPGDALAVVFKNILRPLAGKLLRVVGDVLLQIAADKEPVTR